MKRTILLIVSILMMAATEKVYAYDFSAVAPSGQTLYYKINPNTWTEYNTVTLCPQVQFTYQSFSNYHPYTGVRPSGNLVIPDTVFYNGTYYTVKYIDECAFFKCSGLISVTIPTSVISIRASAFYQCSHLTSITIPNSVDTIEGFAFEGCSNLSSITLPESVTEIGAGLFKGCTSLTSITIPDGVTQIYLETFSGCSSLTSISLGSNIIKIGSNAFYNCSALESITIPNSVTTIEQSAFYNCISLSTIDLGNGLTTIGCRAFYGCSALTSITIPRSVSTIANQAFHSCTSLSTVSFNADSCSFLPSNGSDGVFYVCIGLGTVSFGNNVKTIDKNIFKNCLNISTVRVDWTDSVPYYDAEVGDTNNIFYGIPLSNATLIIPVGTIDLYTNTNTTPFNRPWSFFGNIQEDSSRVVSVYSCNNEMGTTTGTDTVTLGSAVVLTASPNYGYHFVKWSDDNTDNPRTLICVQDTVIVGIFEPNEYTLTCHNAIGGGTYPYMSQIEIFALPQMNMQFRGWSDNVNTNPRTIILISDTIVTAVFTPADTTYIHDTTTLHDSLYMNVYIHDTTYVNVPYAVHDTTYVTLTDTITNTLYVNVYVHDTTYITLTDTVTVTHYDTVTNTMYDTIDNFIYDTLSVIDTLWLTQYDTVWLHDTVFIHDTVYITGEGIDGVDALNTMVYSSRGQIVIEGANGNHVTLYDINGRVLAAKQDEYAPLRFQAPASGTYLIKIGNYPARKVVVIR